MKTMFCAAAILLAFQVAAQNPADKLTNAAVIEIHGMGLGDEVIVQKIRGSSCAFDVSLTGLKELKAAGLSDPVIAEMVHAMSMPLPAVPVAATPVPTPIDPNSPLAPHDSGIYFFDELGATPGLIPIEPTVYTKTKSSGFFKQAFTYGIAKVKTRVILDGKHARTRLGSAIPVFYFYFGGAVGNLDSSTSFISASNPGEFVLVHVKQKKNSRELVVGQFNAFSAEGGVQDEDMVPFDYQKVASGIYKVTPKDQLSTIGEYAFFYGGAPVAAGVGGKIFDFGISPEGK